MPFLVIFDFDDTLVDGNSDVVIPNALGAAATFERLSTSTPRPQWTAMLSEILAPFSKEAITKAVRELTICEDRKLLLRNLSQRADVEVCIASDANTLFIEEGFRQHVGVQPSRVFSNPYVAVGADACASRVDWYMPNGHSCTRCAATPNMCKGHIVQHALNTTTLLDPTIIYVGDGRNDACPIASVLRLRDHALVRRGFALERIVSEGNGGVCHHHFWRNGSDLRLLFEEVTQAVLPPVVTFATRATDAEFRVVSLRKRIPGIIDRLKQDVKGVVKDSETVVNDLDAIRQSLAGGGPLDLRASLPLPPFLAGYGPLWDDQPWLAGEIYLNVLLYHTVHQYSGNATWSVRGLASALMPAPAAGLPVGTPVVPFDMYQHEKDTVTLSHLHSHIVPMANQLVTFFQRPASPPEVRAELHRLISACIWGNAVDLSMFTNAQLAAKSAASPTAASHASQDALLALNHIPQIADCLMGPRPADAGNDAVDVVMDNMGVECAADMLFGLGILRMGLAAKVRFHTKPISYYVSDVMPKDIASMTALWAASEDAGLREWSAAFTDALQSGAIEIHSHPFWTAPCEFRDASADVIERFFFAKKYSPEGTAVVTPRSRLVIFKGDLNFRRLCGDRHWSENMFFQVTNENTSDESVSFEHVLSDFWPKAVPICALRTNKSEVCVGPTTATQEALDAVDKSWRWSGAYGIAAFAC